MTQLGRTLPLLTVVTVLETVALGSTAVAQTPAGWQNGDIGPVAATGSATFANGTFTIEGSGADIWDTADEFHYVGREVEGRHVSITARVTGVEDVHRWTKAGLMIRVFDMGNPGAEHASIFVTPTHERPMAFQRRPTPGGTSVHTDGPDLVAPVWVKLERQHDAISAYYRAGATGDWTFIGRQEFWDLPSNLLVALVVTSHKDGTLATATFDNVSVEVHDMPPSGGMLPPGWSNHDIGDVGAAGTAGFAGGVFTVEGSGADVWGAADEFHYAHTTVTGDFEFTARVTSVENVHRWVKAGLMIREHLGPGARHGFAISTPRTERGLAFQRRPTEGGITEHTAGQAFAPPVWLKIVRRGDVIYAYYRKAITDGWVSMGRQAYMGLSGILHVGFAVTSNVDGTLATATFDNVTFEPLRVWESRDIGNTAAGFTGDDPVIIDIRAGGADIWGRADAFRFRYVPLTGDGAITARVVHVSNSHEWAKAGVMIRETLAPESTHVMALVSAARGLAVQYRSATGGTSANAALAPGGALRWLRLTRAGNTFTAELSEDGTTWSILGGIVVSMSSSVHVGLAVTSHNASTTTVATFDDVLIQEGR